MSELADTLLPDREWTKLLTLMSEGRLIPIIGPELLSIPTESGSTALLYDIWGQKLAELKEINVAQTIEETPLLYRVTNDLNSRMSFSDLAFDIHEVICKDNTPTPSLSQLAEITDFSIYVTTTIDHLMEEALSIARRPQKPHVIAFTGSGRKEDNDVPNGFEPKPGQQPTLFHLFGKTNRTGGDRFAATEDDLIEFSWSLIDNEYSPIHLYEFFQNKTLLLLGCNFPDWLDRFFIHALTRKHEISLKYVSEKRMVGLEHFLERKRAAKPIYQSPVAFVAELHRRWLESQGQQPSISEINMETNMSSKHGIVFISYPREDKAIALVIKSKLEAAEIDTWMDESDLEPGDEFNRVIEDKIDKASFFLALISHSLALEGMDRPGRFVLKEWKWAVETNKSRHENANFLLPLVIDDTQPNASYVDPPFNKINWKEFKNGSLPEDFIAFLRNGIRHYRDPSSTRML
jgi:hypothetical protein